MQIKIAIVLLGFNSARYLPGLLGSLKLQTYSNVEFIYIDNASTDNSVEIVKKNSDFTIIENKINLGYAGAYADFLRKNFREDLDGVVLLNPDVVVEADWLSRLVDFAYSDPSIGIAQPRILELNSELEKTEKTSSIGGDFHYLGFGLLKGEKPDDHSELNDTGFVIGTCMLIKREAYFLSGGLDADYFLYHEDVDLSWRIRILGYRCVVISSSVIWHQYIFNRKLEKDRRKYYFLERNRLYSLFKNYTYRTLVILAPAILIMDAGVFIHSIKEGYLKEKLQANIDFIRNLKFIHSKHKIVQKTRIIKDYEIMKISISNIRFSEVDGLLIRVANKFFELYFNMVKRYI